MAKVKIPKQIGGIEIPKKVRKRAKKAVKMADNPSVRAFAAAAAATARRTAREAMLPGVMFDLLVAGGSRSLRAAAGDAPRRC